MSRSPRRIRIRPDESGVFLVRKIAPRKRQRRAAVEEPRTPAGRARRYRGAAFLIVLVSLVWAVACALWRVN